MRIGRGGLRAGGRQPPVRCERWDPPPPPFLGALFLFFRLEDDISVVLQCNDVLT